MPDTLLLDLDFAIEDEFADRDDKAFDFVSAIDGLSLGQFSYSISERRNKWYIELNSPFNEGDIFKTKLDFGPMPWLDPVNLHFCDLPIHKQYGFELPAIFYNNGFYHHCNTGECDKCV